MSSKLSRAHLRFLILDELVGSVIVNFFLNGAIAWFLFRALASVPLWGGTSIAVDTWVTAFLLPLWTSLITRLLVVVRVSHGKLAPIPAAELRSSAWLRRSSLQRGALLGIAAVVVVATPVVGLFALAGPPALSTAAFIWFKAIFAAALGAVVTPFIGWWELMNASSARSGRSDISRDAVGS